MSLLRPWGDFKGEVRVPVIMKTGEWTYTSCYWRETNQGFPPGLRCGQNITDQICSNYLIWLDFATKITLDIVLLSCKHHNIPHVWVVAARFQAGRLDNSEEGVCPRLHRPTKTVP